jgi:hypothetical protein
MTQPRQLCHWSVTQNPDHDAQLILNTKMQPQVMQKNMVEVFVINYVMSFEVLMDV